MTTKAQAKLTRKQRAWAYKHAKEHIVEALQEALTEEHHSVVVVAAAPETVVGDEFDAQADMIHKVVMHHMERWLKAIRTERAKDFA